MLRTLQLLGSEISPYNHCLRPHSLSLLISSSRSAIAVSHPRLNSVGGRSKALRMSSCRAESNPDVAAAPSASAASSTAATAHKPNVSFCQSCGGPTKLAVPEGEEKMRAVCTLCGRIFYENPKMVVGCLVEYDAKVLLCKRNIQPSYGLWTLPAGFLEMGESAAEGAMRETLEEACAEVEVLLPFAQLDIPRIGQYRVT
ncbi:hypothetical protein QJS10_CPA03g02473 [Acorus calamus]|uniref:Nudix hydrolase domain-containing protein n=1 Tax=Acorus calamus TaxID=4465 RepID=A0AAV9F3T9_ACOCL|nr:hypothetical protein QJS10_CPA03g02473 [Acorus calamus]